MNDSELDEEPAPSLLPQAMGDRPSWLAWRAIPTFEDTRIQSAAEIAFLVGTGISVIGGMVFIVVAWQEPEMVGGIVAIICSPLLGLGTAMTLGFAASFLRALWFWIAWGTLVSPLPSRQALRRTDSLNEIEVDDRRSNRFTRPTDQRISFKSQELATPQTSGSTRDEGLATVPPGDPASLSTEWSETKILWMVMSSTVLAFVLALLLKVDYGAELSAIAGGICLGWFPGFVLAALIVRTRRDQ